MVVLCSPPPFLAKAGRGSWSVDSGRLAGLFEMCGVQTLYRPCAIVLVSYPRTLFQIRTHPLNFDPLKANCQARGSKAQAHSKGLILARIGML